MAPFPPGPEEAGREGQLSPTRDSPPFTALPGPGRDGAELECEAALMFIKRPFFATQLSTMRSHEETEQDCVLSPIFPSAHLGSWLWRFSG